MESAPSVGEMLALFLDTHRRLQWVLQHARQTPRFFFGKSSRDLGVAAINGVLNHRRRLDDPIKHNREAMMNVCSRNVAELLGAFAIESQMNYPTVSLIRGARVRNSIAGQVGFLFTSNRSSTGFSPSA